MKIFSLTSLILTLSVILLVGCNNSTKSQKMEKNFSEIVVFGDGLNDMGKWGKLTNYKYPPADLGFYESRWTNGKVWVEHFADSLRLPISLENNYAMGGATTGYYNINEPLRTALQLDENALVVGMLAQIQKYLSDIEKIDNKTLFVLWAGGHDIGNYLEYGQPDLTKYPPAENYKQAIDLLVKAGAKNILVGTMPDMGFSPGYFGTENQHKASELCLDLNNGLHELENYYKSTEINFYIFDGAAIFAKIGMNPDEYGIKYTDAYLPVNIINFMAPLEKSNVAIPNKDKNLNPDEFMNWWAVSASAKVHEILADEAFKFINSKE